MKSNKEIALNNKEMVNFVKEFKINKGDFVLGKNGEVFKVGDFKKDSCKGSCVELLHQYDDGTWGHYGTTDFKEFADEEYIKLDKPIEQIEQETLEEIGDLSKYEESEELSNSKEIALARDKSALISMQNALKEKTTKFEVMRRIIERKANELRNIMCMVIWKN